MFQIYNVYTNHDLMKKKCGKFNEFFYTTKCQLLCIMYKIINPMETKHSLQKKKNVFLVAINLW